MISGLRPRRSEALAQIGEVIAQNSAESEKTEATRVSGIPIERPIVGSTERRPLLPIAATVETAQTMTNASFDIPSDGAASSRMGGCYVAPRPGANPVAHTRRI